MEGLKTYIQTAKDYIFPVFCLSCEAEGAWVCEKCVSFLQIEPQLFCPVCHDKSTRGEPCYECGASSALFQHVAMTKYVEDALIGKLIHVFKYQYAEEVMIVIREIISDFISCNGEIFQHINLIIPVPLHKKRYAERGFNQAAYIAETLSKALSIPYEDSALIRSRHTPHQAKLDRAGRIKNVENVFVLSPLADVNGKHILLVDDVYTTGATMQACAAALKDAGARSVSGCTLARG